MRLITKDQRLASRYIPKESTTIEHPEGLGVIYTYTVREKPCAIAYRGTASRSDWHITFRSVESRDEHIAKWFAGLTSAAEYRGQLKSQRAAHKCSWTPGTILYGSWGYDQTNIEFYQVVRISPTGKTAWIREVVHDGVGDTDGDWARHMGGRSIPAINNFAGPEIKVRVQGMGDGSSYCAPTGRCFTLSEWDGRPKSWSSDH